MTHSLEIALVPIGFGIALTALGLVIIFVKGRNKQ